MKGLGSVRVLIADRQSAARSALTLLLEERLGLDVVGRAADSQELLALVGLLRPDIIVLDKDLPGTPTAELLPLLRGCGNARVIVLGMQHEPLQVTESASADAFVLKSDPPKRLLTAIRALSVEDRPE